LCVCSCAIRPLPNLCCVLDSPSAELQSIHDDAAAKETELARLSEEKEELVRARAALEDERAAEAAQAARLRATLAEVESRADADRAAAASAQAEQSRSQLAQSQAALERAQADLHLVTTERNRLRRLAESVQTDMRRLNGALASKAAEVEKAQQENQRLREDLARKSKSLQDALTALAVAMEAPPPGSAASGSAGMGSFSSSSNSGGSGTGSSGGGGGGGGETIIVAAPIHSQKPSAGNLSALQVLCTRLSEACAEKEAQISVLKKQCMGLGKRVIELEAGVLPDFSELAHERRVAAASATAAGGGGEESAASTTSAPSSSSSSAEPHRLVHATSDGSEPRSSGVADFYASSAAAATTPSPISSPLVPLVPSDPLSPGSVLLRSASSSRRTSADPAVIVSHETPSATATTPASRPDFTGRSASPDDAASFPTLPHGDRTAAAGDAPAGASQHSDALP